MKLATSFTLLAALLLTLAPFSKAAPIYVDADNVVLNPQGNTPNSSDNVGPGVSTANGVLYLPDNFLSGDTINGLYQYTNNGMGTIDSITAGGVLFPDGGQILANGLPARAGDANGIYVGVAGGPGGSEYALYGTPLVVTQTTVFAFGYQWAAAGGTLADGTELIVGDLMGVEFFIDTDTDYSNGIAVSELSGLTAYAGAGNQVWQNASGQITLNPGTYYWGISSYGNSPIANYVTADGFYLTAVPEPSTAIFVGVAGLLLFLRRKRTSEQ